MAFKSQPLQHFGEIRNVCGCLRGLFTGPKRVGPAGFAFDIDGVLVRGGGVLDWAKKAISLLHDGTSPLFIQQSMLLQR